MNIIKAIAFGMGLVLASSAAASAQPQVVEFMDGNDLASLNGQDALAAQGYVIGVVDAALAGGTIAIGAGAGHAGTCLPPHANQAQVYAVVMQYIANHPEVLPYPAAADVNAALYQTYPCG